MVNSAATLPISSASPSSTAINILQKAVSFNPTIAINAVAIAALLGLKSAVDKKIIQKESDPQHSPIRNLLENVILIGLPVYAINTLILPAVTTLLPVALIASQAFVIGCTVFAIAAACYLKHRAIAKAIEHAAAQKTHQNQQAEELPSQELDLTNFLKETENYASGTTFPKTETFLEDIEELKKVRDFMQAKKNDSVFLDQEKQNLLNLEKRLQRIQLKDYEEAAKEMIKEEIRVSRSMEPLLDKAKKHPDSLANLCLQKRKKEIDTFFASQMKHLERIEREFTNLAEEIWKIEHPLLSTLKDHLNRFFPHFGAKKEISDSKEHSSSSSSVPLKSTPLATKSEQKNHSSFGSKIRDEVSHLIGKIPVVPLGFSPNRSSSSQPSEEVSKIIFQASEDREPLSSLSSSSNENQEPQKSHLPEEMTKILNATNKYVAMRLPNGTLVPTNPLPDVNGFSNVVTELSTEWDSLKSKGKEQFFEEEKELSKDEEKQIKKYKKLYSKTSSQVAKEKDATLDQINALIESHKNSQELVEVLTKRKDEVENYFEAQMRHLQLRYSALEKIAKEIDSFAHQGAKVTKLRNMIHSLLHHKKSEKGDGRVNPMSDSNDVDRLNERVQEMSNHLEKLVEKLKNKTLSKKDRDEIQQKLEKTEAEFLTLSGKIIANPNPALEQLKNQLKALVPSLSQQTNVEGQFQNSSSTSSTLGETSPAETLNEEGKKHPFPNLPKGVDFNRQADTILEVLMDLNSKENQGTLLEEDKRKLEETHTSIKKELKKSYQEAQDEIKKEREKLLSEIRQQIKGAEKDRSKESTDQNILDLKKQKDEAKTYFETQKKSLHEKLDRLVDLEKNLSHPLLGEIKNDLKNFHKHLHHHHHEKAAIDDKEGEESKESESSSSSSPEALSEKSEASSISGERDPLDNVKKFQDEVNQLQTAYDGLVKQAEGRDLTYDESEQLNDLKGNLKICKKLYKESNGNILKLEKANKSIISDRRKSKSHLEPEAIANQEAQTKKIKDYKKQKEILEKSFKNLEKQLKKLNPQSSGLLNSFIGNDRKKKNQQPIPPLDIKSLETL